MSVAIVTGASRGLGEALASGLVSAGWSVVIDGRDADALAVAADRIRALARPGTQVVALTGDITDAGHRSDLTGAAFDLGGLDLVVNNAGTLGASPLPPLADYPLGELRVAFEVNVVAPLGLIQDALPLLLDSPRPRLIDITSDAAVEPYDGWGGYGAGKAALDQISAVLAAELPGLRVW
jgi:NAD(P)-dependent dehydrogenase (short-subunit alcohol dehydrogenase family)